MLPITNDVFWDVMPNIDKEVHTTTYVLSHLEVPSNKLHCCRVPEAPSNELHVVASHKYRKK